MARLINRLSSRTVETEKRHGRHPDGDGLHLEIDKHGRRWALRLRLNGGKRTWVGLGPVSEVTLAEARQKAQERRKAAKAGDLTKTHQREPRSKPAAPAGGTSFRQAFHQHFEEHVRATLDPDYAPKYIRMVEAVILHSIGDMDVAEIRPKHIAEALKPAWKDTPEQATKVAARASRVFKWAIVHELRRDDDPVKAAREVLGRERPKIEHRPSIPWQHAPGFVQWLRSRSLAHPSTVLCLEMIVATALRSREARLARWQEFDLVAQEWNVPSHDEVEARERGLDKPKARMKGGIAQVVPLSPLAMDVLARAADQRRSSSPEALVFPSATGEVLSVSTLSKLFRDNKIEGTPHGLRATLRTWCQEMKVDHDVAEKLLSHGEADLTLAAYKRATFFDERRVVLNRWSDFLLAPQTAGSPKLSTEKAFGVAEE